jgi:hypothetical protein
VLSIQDDEGYLRLAKRLAGLDVLMYMGPRLVKNSLGPASTGVPAEGTYRYRGRVSRIHAQGRRLPLRAASHRGAGSDFTSVSPVGRRRSLGCGAQRS